MTHPKIESLRSLALRAHSGTSFDPEKRANYIVNTYSEELTNDLELIKKHSGDTERYESKYISMLSDWLSAKSRCISSMITGPSNFPVRRAEKANNSEHNKSVAFTEWREKALHSITRPESTDIVKGTDGAIEKMSAKLETLEAVQSTMKGVNKIVRNKKLSDVEKVEQITTDYPRIKEEAAIKLLEPDCYGGLGFPSYSMTNNNAKISNLKKDITAEQRRLEKYSTGNKEYEINGIQIIENAEENRLQLLFDGKPEREMIAKLKSHGFRWSPRNMAWQRQLTNNALYTLKLFLK